MIPPNTYGALMIPLNSLRAEWKEVGPVVSPAMHRVLASGRYLHGEEVPRFEKAWAEYVGAEHCVGVASGTAALELALRAHGVGDLRLKRAPVIVPALGFVATPEAVINAGGVPVFCDVEKTTGNIEPVLAGAIARQVKARFCIPVCLHGAPVDIIALRRHLPDSCAIILDCAQAAGGRPMHTKLPLLGERWGELGFTCCWSFYPSKNLGAYGDAGAVTTESEMVARYVRANRDHGREPGIQLGSGGNRRMDEIQAAALHAKLPLLDTWIVRRCDLATRYVQLLDEAACYLPRGISERSVGHAWHHFEVRLLERDQVRKFLNENGVGAKSHYWYILPELMSFGGDGARSGPTAQRGNFPVAADIASRTLSLPLWPRMEEEHQDAVVALLGTALEHERVTHAT